MPHTIMDKHLFRKVTSGEVDAAYTVYNAAFDWLQAKGVRQWNVRKPRSLFERYQSQGDLYGLFAGGDVAAMAALSPDRPSHWDNEKDVFNGQWIYRLSLKPALRGHGIGAQLVRHLVAEAGVRGATHVCLRCG